MKRGDIVRVDLPRPVGAPGREQFGLRPAIVVQDEPGLSVLSTVLVIPMTSNLLAEKFIGSFRVSPSSTNGLTVESIAMTQQVRAIDRSRIQSVIGYLSPDELKHVDRELRRLLKL